MLSNTACYGRAGLSAGSGERVTALVGRTTDGLTKAMTAFDTTLARIKSGGFVPWTAPAAEMTLLHAQWLSLVSWQWATILTDAAVVSGQGDDIDKISYTLAVQYCADAADLSVRAMQIANVVVREGKRPGNAAIVPPGSHLNASLLEPTWALLSSMYERVSTDLAWIRRLGVPSRFGSAYATLEGAFRPDADVFRYHQDQWRVSIDTTSRRQILQDAIRLFPGFFKVGQQVWAPYLVGRVFVDTLRSSAVFEKYNLGIDPWALTDPAAATVRSTDQQSCVVLAEFWKTVADPRSAIALQNLINDAVMLGQVEFLADRSYKIPPWHGQYRVFEPLTLGHLQFDADAIIAINFRGAPGHRVAEIRQVGKA